MNNDENKKRLERQARSLILSKELAADDRDRINALMRDQSVSFEERYTDIIRILKSTPDKEMSEIKDEDDNVQTPGRIKNPRLKKPVSVNKERITKDILISGRKYPDINGPTETKLYINEIYIRFRKFKFFKKRCLVRRNNRIGLGFSKRIIPSKKFLCLMNEVRSYQETILSRLPQLLEAILKDETVENPHIIYQEYQ